MFPTDKYLSLLDADPLNVIEIAVKIISSENGLKFTGSLF